MEKEGKEYIAIKKTTLKKTGVIVFLIYVLTFSIFVVVSQIKISNKIDNLLNISAINAYESPTSIDTLQISTMDYYKEYELNDSMNLTHTKKGEDYMLYFHSDTCQYCLEANVFINQYITLGYQEKTPIYFVTPDKASSLFDKDKFNVESTPTLIYYSAKDDNYSTYVGSDEIFNKLDQIVSIANGE